MNIRKSSGFTLIEILIVITIIAFLFAFLGPKIVRYLGQTEEKKVQLMVGSLREALINYKLVFGSYPTTKEGLKALVENLHPNDDRYRREADKWPFAREDEIKDPSGIDFIYHCPPEKYKNKYKQFEIIWIGSGTEDEPKFDAGA
jgi:general secretion pathway protein G